nr:MAG TPA: hypothetical protein [Caudoviricetes sp.]
MSKVTYTTDNEETKITVKVTAKLSDDGVDIKVDSDSDTPMAATALFLGLMASYGVTEEEATEIFEKMTDMVEKFKAKGAHKHGRYLN